MDTEGAILVEMDFSRASKQALKHAYRLAKDSRRSVRVMRIVKSADRVGSEEARLKALLDSHKTEVPVDSEVRVGDLARELLSESRSSQMIILGVRGDRETDSLSERSPQYEVATRSACPVLLTWQPDA